MKNQIIAPILAALLLAVPTASIAEAPLMTMDAARQRLAELRRQVQDRATADAALRSYFQHLNNYGEIICLTTELNRQTANAEYDQIVKLKDAIRDSFFTSFPVKTFHQYDGFNYDECMSERETLSYYITGVEPVGDKTTNIAVVVKNTTPLRPGMKPTSYDIERRASGSRFRFSFVKQGDEWKIDQIEEWNTYSEGWSKEFKPDDLDPMVPSLIMIARHL